MAVFYKKLERGNPLNKTAPKKWYAVLRRARKVTEKEVAIALADETTLNRKEAEMVLAQFQKILIRHLLEGNSVQLGDWGTFRLTCNSEGFDSKNKVTANGIKNVKIRFTAGGELRDALKKSEFIDIESMAN